MSTNRLRPSRAGFTPPNRTRVTRLNPDLREGARHMAVLVSNSTCVISRCLNGPQRTHHVLNAAALK